MNKNILITGGAGYIGSHCALLLLEHGYNVVVLDNGYNVQWGKSEKPECLLRIEKMSGKMVPFVKADLLDKSELFAVFKEFKIDCVLHCAALKSVSESVKDPLSYYFNNITGSLNLFAVMSKFGIKNIIFSSSSTVYGEPNFLPLTEIHPTGQNIANPYGKTKFMVEEILKDLVISDPEWRVYTLRYFNPVGGHPTGELGEDPSAGPANNLMPIIVQVACGMRNILSIYGKDYDTVDGSGVRDYIHIIDLADGHVAAIDALLDEKSAEGIFKAYNLGCGQGYSVLQVIHAFESVNNVKVPYKFEARRPGDIATSYCAANLAEKELNWKAKYELSEMCRDAWNWYVRNPNGYQGSD